MRKKCFLHFRGNNVTLIKLYFVFNQYCTEKKSLVKKKKIAMSLLRHWKADDTLSHNECFEQLPLKVEFGWVI